MAIVQLGNSEPTGVDVPTVTTVTIPAPIGSGPGEVSVADVVTSIAAVSEGGITGGTWQAHSTAHAPDWVWSDNPDVEEAIAAHYGCARGVPSDVEQRYYTTTPPGVDPQEV